MLGGTGPAKSAEGAFGASPAGHSKPALSSSLSLLPCEVRGGTSLSTSGEEFVGTGDLQVPLKSLSLSLLLSELAGLSCGPGRLPRLGR